MNLTRPKMKSQLMTKRKKLSLSLRMKYLSNLKTMEKEKGRTRDRSLLFLMTLRKFSTQRQSLRQ